MPPDLLALVAHGSLSSYQNHAWPRERLGTHEAQPTLSVLRDQILAFGKQRNAWVSVRRQRLLGLAGARDRGGKQAWEIDYLVDCTGNPTIVTELLERAVKAAGESRAEKLFLRLKAASPLLNAAHEVGFVPIRLETLYARQNTPAGAEPAPVRKATPADTYPLFRLYNRTTPETERRNEAATYSEWQAATEQRWLRGGIELIAEEGTAIKGAVRASRLVQGVMLDITLEPEDLQMLEGLLQAAAKAIPAAASPFLTLAPANDEALIRQLEGAGFRPQGEFVSLMHRTTRPLSLPRAMPAAAKNAVGVRT